VAGSKSEILQVWDLRRIHDELRDLGLDWPSPSF
jgi:hypothetical protein